MLDLMSHEYANRYLREHGFALPRDSRRAEEWCIQQAQAGVVNAQCVLSTLYWTGGTGNQDAAQARHWSEVAASNGSLDAKSALARHLISGNGGERNVSLGVQMLRDLVEREHLPSMVALGLLMLSGEIDSVPADREQALDLLIVPAQAGEPLSRCLVGAELVGSASPTDRETGRRWIELAADDGVAMAHHYLAKFYRHGEHGFPVDRAKAEMHEAAATRLEKSDPLIG